MLLSVNDIHVYYGAIHAVKGVSLEVNEGEVVTLIGANGAGKSTVLNTISGLLRAKSGTIDFMGTPINTMAPNKIVQLGLAQCPEGRRVFAHMTVEENLEMGAYNRKDKDGNTRPIHTKNAEKVLHFERDSQWVKENIAIEPILIEEGEGYKEYVVGRTELMYYETHRIELDTRRIMDRIMDSLR